MSRPRAYGVEPGYYWLRYREPGYTGGEFSEAWTDYVLALIDENGDVWLPGFESPLVFDWEIERLEPQRASSWRPWQRPGEGKLVTEPWLTLAVWLHRFWYAIPGTWRAELYVRELWMYGGRKKRKEALGHLHAYLDSVLEGRPEPLDACQRGEHSFSWRQGIEPCRYCGQAPATSTPP